MEEKRYEIKQLIGKGRTGGVYKAEDKVLSRKVALRRFYDVNANSSEYTEEFMVLNQQLGAIQHPELLSIFDAGVDDEGPYLVSQFIEGVRFYDVVLEKQKLDPYDLCDFARQILEALATAHDAGVHHGALNPNSILCVERPRGGYQYIIMDLGLARLESLILGEKSAESTMADPSFMAPEMFESGVTNAKSDLYMIGQLCFYAFVGGHPYADKNYEESRQAHQEAVPPLSQFREDTPPELEAWVSQLTDLNPAARPDSLLDAVKNMPAFERPLHQTTAYIHNAPAQLTSVVTQTPAGVVQTGAVQASIVAGGVVQLESQKEKNFLPWIVGVIIMSFIVLVWMIFGKNRERSSEIVLRENTQEEVIEPTEQLKEAQRAEKVISERKTETPTPEVEQKAEPALVEERESDSEQIELAEGESLLVWTGKSDTNLYNVNNWRVEGVKLSDNRVIGKNMTCEYNILIDQLVTLDPLTSNIVNKPNSSHTFRGVTMAFEGDLGFQTNYGKEAKKGEISTIVLAKGTALTCGKLQRVHLTLKGNSSVVFSSSRYLMADSQINLTKGWVGSITFEKQSRWRVTEYYIDKFYMNGKKAVEGKDFVLKGIAPKSYVIVPVR